MERERERGEGGGEGRKRGKRKREREESERGKREEREVWIGQHVNLPFKGTPLMSLISSHEAPSFKGSNSSQGATGW